jgi:uncharacterized membrane protein YeaQ/YmgE (transglycosylase-associated protein family)
MLATILIGFVVGVIARWLKPGELAVGFVMTVLVGIGGAVLATLVGQHLGWYAHGDKAGFLASVGGALALLVVYEAVKPRLVRREAPPEK